MVPFLETTTIPEAYFRALQVLKNEDSLDHLVVKIRKPLLEASPLTLNINVASKYEDLIDFGSYRDFHEKYKWLTLRNKSGGDWIKDRIRVLCPDVKELSEEIRQLDVKCRKELSALRSKYGLVYKTENYVDRLTRYGNYEGMLYMHWSRPLNQLAIIIYKLAKDVPRHGQKSFVYGVLSIFDPLKENLQLICNGRTANIGQFPCLSIIDLKLSDNTLNLCALWRHQYFDIKAYGNWISLALLMKIICDLTNHFRKKFGFKEVKYGKITSIASRANFSSNVDKGKVISLVNV
jgi:hypothetical protein